MCRDVVLIIIIIIIRDVVLQLTVVLSDINHKTRCDAMYQEKVCQHTSSTRIATPQHSICKVAVTRRVTIVRDPNLEHCHSSLSRFASIYKRGEQICSPVHHGASLRLIWYYPRSRHTAANLNAPDSKQEIHELGYKRKIR